MDAAAAVVPAKTIPGIPTRGMGGEDDTQGRLQIRQSSLRVCQLRRLALPNPRKRPN
jgi:hypothetical protein